MKIQIEKTIISIKRNKIILKKSKGINYLKFLKNNLSMKIL